MGLPDLGKLSHGFINNVTSFAEKNWILIVIIGAGLCLVGWMLSMVNLLK